MKVLSTKINKKACLLHNINIGKYFLVFGYNRELKTLLKYYNEELVILND